jgi:membrane-bound serine protease (ClpP class)
MALSAFLRHVVFWGMLVWLFATALAPSPVVRAEPLDQDGQPLVYVLTFSGAVTPVLESYLQDAIESGGQNGADAIVLRLDTPGGSVEVTKRIIQRMLASPIPIVVYVAPSGAHAGSAGTFITLAAHIAAMAPGTSIGAASPVGSGGEDIDETMAAKVKNILSADIENLAKRRGERATEWAIAAVQEAAAATAQQALDLGVIDLIAAGMPELLEEIDGKEVTVAGGPLTLHTANAIEQPLELNWLERLLNLISDPVVAQLLLSLGGIGLIIEMYSPGFGIPGILGVIFLLLGFYALGQLDANFTGLILMALALILFVAEAFTPTFGVLALGGMIAFVAGGILLFDAPGLEIPWAAIIACAIVLGAFAVFAGGAAVKAQRNPVVTGGEALIGQIATVKQPFRAGEAGSVFIAGEWWNAELREGSLAAGDKAQIVGRRGYTLVVKPVTRSQVLQEKRIGRTDPYRLVGKRTTRTQGPR